MTQFDRRAHEYDKHAHVQEQMADWLAEWLPGMASPACRAVEYGAGEGMFTRRALPFLSNLQAFDLAPQMVAVGREHTPAAEWFQGDAWQGEGLSSEVGLVLSASLMQWCPDPLGVLSRWLEALPVGAEMLHGFYVEPTLPELLALQGANTMPLNWRTPDAWRLAFEEAGWTVEQMETVERRIHYRNALALLRSLHGVGAVRRVQSHGTSLRRLMREYDRRHRLPGGGVYASWTFCRIHVRKQS